MNPDGPTTTKIAYLVGHPEADDDKLLLTGATGKKFWKLCRAEGMPARPKLNEQGKVGGPATSTPMVKHAPRVTAWVGSVMPAVPRGPLKKREQVVQAAIKHHAACNKRLPIADVYVLVGPLACYVGHSAHLPSKYVPVTQHAGSVIPAENTKGLLTYPEGSKVVVMRSAACLNAGEDQWYPNLRLSLRRASQLVGLSPHGPFPKAPEHTKHLWGGNPDHVMARARVAGYVVIDIETPYTTNDKIYICSFTVKGKSWIFGLEETKEILERCIKLGIRIVHQNGATFDLPTIYRALDVDVIQALQYDTRWADASHRPRMPRGLAHLATHYLPEGPENWKPMSEGVDACSEQGRDYCAKDGYYTERIFLAQMEGFAQKNQQAVVERLDRLLPVITNCAIEGANIDLAVRNDLRVTMKEAHDQLFEDFAASIQAKWGDKLVKDWKAEEGLMEGAYQEWKTAAFKKKGEAIRKKYGVTIEQAVDFRKQYKEHIDSLRKKIEAHSNIRPTQTDIIRDYLFHSKSGLRIKATGQKTPTGLLKVGRKELSALLHRSDVQSRIEKGEIDLYILRTIADAERLRATLENHLGAELDASKNITLDYDDQIHKGRMAVVYNPVQARFSAGKAKEKADPRAMQVHNQASVVEATVNGKAQRWNPRKQFIADDPQTQLVGAWDWSKHEQYIMAWQAGQRVGDWSWLETLYSGVDTHCETASIAFPDYPMCDSSKDCIHRTNHIDAGGVPRNVRWVGKQVNHAATLGATANMLNVQYDIPLKQGRQIMARFAASPRGRLVTRLHAALEQEAMDTSWVRYPFNDEGVDFYAYQMRGSRLRIANPNRVYASAQQGPAAIIMQICMPQVHDILTKFGGRVILSTHDEFVGCFLKSKKSAALKAVAEVMEQEWPQMPVPFDNNRGLKLLVEAGCGTNWHDAHGG